jgi:hypothetical protein
MARTPSREGSSTVAEIPPISTACMHVENSKDASHGRDTDISRDASNTNSAYH